MADKISRREVAAAIAERTKHVDDPHLLAQEVAAYLLHEDRVDELDSLLRDILDYRQKQGHLEARVTTAHPLSDDQLQEVKTLVTREFESAKTVRVSNQVDSRVIGGLKIDTADQQLNLSIQAKLHAFKRLTGAGGGM